MTLGDQRRQGRLPRTPKVLVVLGSVLAFLAIFAVWIERQALDTSDWVDTSSRLLEDEQIRDALANFAVDELYANLDVEALLQKRLPPQFKPLSGPAASGLRQVGLDAAERVLASNRFLDTWERLNRAAHQRLVAIVEGEGIAETEDGKVRLELRPLLLGLTEQIGIGARVADRLPPDAGSLEVIDSDDLGLAQELVGAIRGLALLSALGAVVLFALAIFLARETRWVVMLGCGTGLLIAGVLVLILREIAGNLLVDRLAAPSAEPAAAAAWSIGTGLLSSVATTVILYAAVFGVAGWLGSPHGGAVAARRFLAAPLRDHPAWVFGVLALLAAIFVLSVADSTRGVLTRLALVALAAAGVVALRRMALTENPEARMGDMGVWLRAARTSFGKRGREPAAEDQRLERLERLAALRERGLLSDEELEVEKRALLGDGRGQQESGKQDEPRR